MNTRAKTSDYIVTNLDEIGARGVAPSNANDPDATMVTTIKIVYLPAYYASLLLDHAGYTIKQMRDILYPASMPIIWLIAKLWPNFEKLALSSYYWD
jgi:hypothetical protein